MPTQKALAARRDTPDRIAPPERVLAAAKEAPLVFSIGAYFHALYVMRRKGYSWRQLAGWVAKFNIEISHVHLRRLYVAEDARLTRLSKAQLAAQGLPDDVIQEITDRADPTARLVAADPEDGALEARREKMLRDAGIPDEQIERIDLTEPITFRGETL